MEEKEAVTYLPFFRKLVNFFSKDTETLLCLDKMLTVIIGLMRYDEKKVMKTINDNANK